MAIEGADGVVDQNAGGASSDGGGNSGASDPQNSNGQQTAPKPAPGASPDKTEEYEKRFKGLTNDLQKERRARQDYERRVAKYETDLAAERQRVQALAGVTPQSSAEAENEAIRKRFNELYPHIGDLTKEDIEALRELKTRKSELDETTRHYWTSHSRKMVEGVQSEIEKELGGKLTDRQRQQVERLYALQGEADEEFLERHSRGDQTLVAEFAKQFIEDWFEPARRKVTQQEAQRFRAVPTGKDRGIVTHGEKKIDVTDNKAVEDILVRGFRERNGEFSRR
jgi:hypothetical protein